MNDNSPRSNRGGEGAAPVYSPQHPLREMAAQDARGMSTPEEASHLRNPETAPEWLAALKELKGDMDSQFSARNAAAQEFQNECFQMSYGGKQRWFNYKAELDSWRAKANRMKRSIENRISEAKQITQGARTTNERESFRSTLHYCRDFLMNDANLSESGVERKEELLATIEDVLWGSKKPRTPDQRFRG